MAIKAGNGANAPFPFLVLICREVYGDHRMWSEIIWGTCIGLESLLPIRAARIKLLRRFPVFYSYIAFVLLIDLLAIPVLKMSANIYILFYWLTQLLKAFLGYGVIVEIYNLSLKNYLGVVRLVKILLLIVFLAVAMKVGINLLDSPQIILSQAIADMEHNLQQVQAVLLFCLLALLIYYKIPVNRNLRGLLLGYSLLIGADVITFTFISHPATGFALLMRDIVPVCYAIALIIWLVALWSPSPEQVFQGSKDIERDYQNLARETRILLLRARTHLFRVARP